MRIVVGHLPSLPIHGHTTPIISKTADHLFFRKLFLLRSRHDEEREVSLQSGPNTV